MSRDIKWDNFIGADANKDLNIFEFEADIEIDDESRENDLVIKALPAKVEIKEFDQSEDEDEIISKLTTTGPRRQALTTLREMASSTHGMKLRNRNNVAGRKVITGEYSIN
jgi:hypothetical protein